MTSQGFWADLYKGQADAAKGYTPPSNPPVGYQEGYKQASGGK